MSNERQPTLYLVRGLPGSGKTSTANHLAVGLDHNDIRNVVVSADDYFVRGLKQEYVFDASKLPEAHAYCQDWAFRALASGADAVVHNTFTCRWEMEPYLLMAARHNARVVVIDCYDGGMNDAKLTEVNTHGVPLRTIENMRRRYEHDWRRGNPLPPWER